MKKQQWLLILGGVALTAALFFLGETSILADKKPEMLNAASTRAHQHINFAEVINETKSQLPSAPAEKINELEEKLSGAAEGQKEEIYKNLATEWDSLQKPGIAGNYYEQIYQLTNNKEDLQKAADRYFVAFRIAQFPEKKEQFADHAIHGYEKLIELDSSGVENQIRLALSHIEGTSQPMNGVMMLLDVVKKEPQNVQANLWLGKLAIFSGQYDKAIERLKNLINFAPQNAEAYYYLAEAYSAKNNKQEAIKNYNKSRELIKNPVFDEEIKKKIEKLN